MYRIASRRFRALYFRVEADSKQTTKCRWNLGCSSSPSVDIRERVLFKTDVCILTMPRSALWLRQRLGNMCRNTATACPLFRFSTETLRFIDRRGTFVICCRPDAQRFSVRKLDVNDDVCCDGVNELREDLNRENGAVTCGFCVTARYGDTHTPWLLKRRNKSLSDMWAVVVYVCGGVCITITRLELPSWLNTTCLPPIACYVVDDFRVYPIDGYRNDRRRFWGKSGKS